MRLVPVTLIAQETGGTRHLESGDFYLTIGNQKVKFELVDE